MQTIKFHVKTGDTVAVITGKDKNKTGKILKVDTRKNGALVEGLNVVKRHTRARNNQPGSLVEKEALIQISNIMLYCEKCKKPVKAKSSLLQDGKKARVCKKCGESFDK
ncbi:MAG: 50S ribosomal protein L24 [Geobacteraceae bacterium]|nr:50S ribosomal protein L24 [Geobacteraceae bacterium]